MSLGKVVIVVLRVCKDSETQLVHQSALFVTRSHGPCRIHASFGFAEYMIHTTVVFFVCFVCAKQSSPQICHNPVYRIPFFFPIRSIIYLVQDPQ